MRTSEFPHSEKTERIIGAAIKVHRVPGPGSPEAAYEACLADQWQRSELSDPRQMDQPVVNERRVLDCGNRLDSPIDVSVIVELKCDGSSRPIHEAQRLRCLRLSGMEAGLLMTFNVPQLRDGIVRRVRSQSRTSSASSAPLR